MHKDACVRNDLEMDSKTKLMIVSGSNMSGKSTYLRTVGINTVLAFAGASVKAKTMQISPMALAAVLKIQDSLAEGKSRFYAEIQRVRQVVDLADGAVPVFFFWMKSLAEPIPTIENWVHQACSKGFCVDPLLALSPRTIFLSLQLQINPFPMQKHPLRR